MTDIVEIAAFVLRAIAGVLPAFVLSIGLAVLIQKLRLDGLIRRAFEARTGAAIVLSAAVGAFSPLCSCTVIPVVSGLLLSGVPLAPVMAFWVASPTMDPEMFALTVATLGWPLAITRLAATVVLSLGAGYLTLALTRSGLLGSEILRRARRAVQASAPARLLPVIPAQGGATPLGPARAIAGGSDPAAPAAGGSCCGSPAPARRPETASGAPAACCTGAPEATAPPATPCCDPATAATLARPAATASGCCGSDTGAAAGGARAGWTAALAAGLREVRPRPFLRDMGVQGYRLGRWLVLAFVLEALILRYVPQAAIAGVLGDRSAFAVVLAALVGIPLYLNNVSALPIVSGLLAQGMQPGAAVAFLIAGPVTTVPAMSAVWGVVTPRVFALYVGIGLMGAILLGALANLVLG